MYKDPYEILGVSRSASKDEIESAYLRLRDKYRLDMHSEGAKGKEAAKKLNEVENAYGDVLSNLSRRADSNDQPQWTPNSNEQDDNGGEQTKTFKTEILEEEYVKIESLIRDKQFADAQRALDNIDNRNANWHYYQSVIYYKMGRMQESKAQLELACSMDTDNQRFKNSLDKLNAKLASGEGNGNPSIPTQPSNGYHRSYAEDDKARAAEDGCCQACQALICLNCFCDCCCR